MLEKVEEIWCPVYMIWKSKSAWIGHTHRRKGLLLKTTTERMVPGKMSLGRRSDIIDEERYEKMKRRTVRVDGIGQSLYTRKPVLNVLQSRNKPTY